MRGRRTQQASMLAFVDLEERVPSPAAYDQALCRLSFVRAVADVRSDVRLWRPTVDPTRAAAESPADQPRTRCAANAPSAKILTTTCSGVGSWTRVCWSRASTSPRSARTVAVSQHVVAQRFFDVVVRQAEALGLLSDEHVKLDNTLIEAAASLNSFKPRHKLPSDPPNDPGNPTVNFCGDKRSNATHQSTTDPKARLAKKGRGFEFKLAYVGLCADGESAWSLARLPNACCEKQMSGVGWLSRSHDRAFGRATTPD
jgi:hypothetical protein